MIRQQRSASQNGGGSRQSTPTRKRSSSVVSEDRKVPFSNLTARLTGASRVPTPAEAAANVKAIQLKEAASWLHQAAVLQSWEKSAQAEVDEAMAAISATDGCLIASDTRENERHRHDVASELRRVLLASRGNYDRLHQRTTHNLQLAIDKLRKEEQLVASVVTDAKRMVANPVLTTPRSSADTKSEVRKPLGSLDNNDHSRKKKPVTARVSSGPPSQPNEVAELDAFVHEHGTTLGWAEHDHKVFLRVVAANCKIGVAVEPSANGVMSPVAVDQIIAQLPHLDAGDVRQHYVLHNRYLELVSRKRIAVEAWRAQRAATEQEAADAALLAKDDEARRRTEVEMMKDEQRKRRQEKLAESVREWRHNKEQALALSALAATAARSARDQEHVAKEQVRSIQLHQRVEKFHDRQKAIQQATVAAAVARKPARRTSSATLEKRHEQDLKQVAARRERIAAAQEKAKPHAVTPRARSSSAHRDPNRLLQPTASVASRLASEQEDRHGDEVLLRGVRALGPRPLTGFRGSASWCGQTHLR